VIQELLTTLQRKEEEIYQSQINIEHIKKYAFELQAFSGLTQIQGISMKNETYIHSLVEDDNFKETQLRFKADDQILNIMTSPGERIASTILPLDIIQHPSTLLRYVVILCFILSITSLTDLTGMLTTLR
jgi:hypothetical protein